MDVSNERARAAGLTLTDPATTLRDMRAWMQGRDLTPTLSPEREAELIRCARQENDGQAAATPKASGRLT
jgi:2'-hydroxyisoflavone reductase